MVKHWETQETSNAIPCASHEKIDIFRERKYKKHGYNVVKSGLNIIPARMWRLG